jgi:DNA primase
LLRADAAETVFICEGEKDADKVAALGLVATTSPGGAGKWPAHFSRWFIGKQRVAVLADNDAPGREHVNQVADNLCGSVADIRILEFPELAEKGDVSDWLEQGHGKADLLDRAGEAPAYKRKVEIRVGGALMRKKLPPRVATRQHILP